MEFICGSNVFYSAVNILSCIVNVLIVAFEKDFFYQPHLKKKNFNLTFSMLCSNLIKLMLHFGHLTK